VNNIHCANITLVTFRLRAINLTCFSTVHTVNRRLLLNTECTHTILLELNPFLVFEVASEWSPTSSEICRDPTYSLCDARRSISFSYAVDILMFYLNIAMRMQVQICVYTDFLGNIRVWGCYVSYWKDSLMMVPIKCRNM